MVEQGQILHNSNGKSYEVIMTREFGIDDQELLLKQVNGTEVVIARSWNEEYHQWHGASYYGSSDLPKLKKSFLEKRRKGF